LKGLEVFVERVKFTKIIKYLLRLSFQDNIGSEPTDDDDQVVEILEETPMD